MSDDTHEGRAVSVSCLRAEVEPSLTVPALRALSCSSLADPASHVRGRGSARAPRQSGLHSAVTLRQSPDSVFPGCVT